MCGYLCFGFFVLALIVTWWRDDTRKICVFYGGAVVGIGTFAVAIFILEPKYKPRSANTTRPKANNLARLRVAASSLAADFAADASRAAQEHGGKTYHIQGRVSSVLLTSKLIWLESNVRCSFDELPEQVGAGDSVVIKGRIKSAPYLSRDAVLVDDCQLMSLIPAAEHHAED
jgi:hypothetical protein